MAAARSYVGVKWRHQGRSRSGMDCAGLVIRVPLDLGILPDGFDFRAYHRYPDGKTLERTCEENLDHLDSFAKVQPGDVLTMHDLGTRWPCHMGIVADRPGGGFNLVHSWAHLPIRRVVEARLDDFWLSKVTGCWAYRGVS